MAVISKAAFALLLTLGFVYANPSSQSRDVRRTASSSSWHRNRRLNAYDGRTHAMYHHHLQRATQRYASVVLGDSPTLERRYNQIEIQKAISHLEATQADPEAPANMLFLDDVDNPNPQGEGFSSVALEIALVQPVIKAEVPSYPLSVGLDIQANDIGYIATVQIGSPPKNFSLFVDSGSSDLWVGAEYCKGYDFGDCGSHTFLGNTSTTFNDTGDPWHIRYGSGFVLGNIVTDHVNIAGVNSTKPHTFGIATEESPEFASNKIPYDGFLGTAKSSLSQQRTPTLIEALKQEGLVKEGIVSYHIPRALDTMKPGESVKNYGEMTFGGMNPAKYNASTLVTVNNLSPTGFWEVPVSDVRIDGASIGLQARSAILDTGSTLLVAPKADVAAIHQLIPGSLYTGSRWIIPCMTNTTLSLVISGQEFPIDSRDLLFLPLSMSNLKGYCWSTIGEMATASKPKGTNVTKERRKTTSWLVGDVFLKNVYFSTNLDRDTISLAILADNTNVTDPAIPAVANVTIPQ